MANNINSFLRVRAPQDLALIRTNHIRGLIAAVVSSVVGAALLIALSFEYLRQRRRRIEMQLLPPVGNAEQMAEAPGPPETLPLASTTCVP